MIQSDEAHISPSLLGGGASVVPAFEYKFLVAPGLAASVLEAAREVMVPDPYATCGASGAYWIHTVYLDTARQDVLERRRGFRRDKFRIRRYGQEDVVYLERKSRLGCRVRKLRLRVDGFETEFRPDGIYALNGDAEWFGRGVRRSGLIPAAEVHYFRTALVGGDSARRMRLTVDREAQGIMNPSWLPQTEPEGRSILERSVVLEFKFTRSLPPFFASLIRSYELSRQGVSKYQLCGRTFAKVLGGEAMTVE